MADSIQLQSDQYLAPFEHEANQAEYQARVQTPQLALQSFLAMRKHAMESAENQAHVALENAQLQDYYQRIQAFNTELQTRQALAQTQMAEVGARKAREEMETSLAPFKGTGLQLGEVQETEPGRYGKFLPNAAGRPSWVDATPEDIQDYKESRSAKLERTKAAAEEDRAKAQYYREGHYGTNRGAAGEGKPSAPNPVVIDSLGARGWRQGALSTKAQDAIDDLEKRYGSTALGSYLSTLVNNGMRLPKAQGLDEQQIMTAILENLAENPQARMDAEAVLNRLSKKK